MVTRKASSVAWTHWDVEKEKIRSTGNGHSAIRTAGGDLAKATNWSPDGRLTSIITMGDKTESGTTYWADHLNVIDTDSASASILNLCPRISRCKSYCDELEHVVQSVSHRDEDGQVEVISPRAKRIDFSRKISAEPIHARSLGTPTVPV